MSEVSFRSGKWLLRSPVTPRSRIKLWVWSLFRFLVRARSIWEEVGNLVASILRELGSRDPRQGGLLGGRLGGPLRGTRVLA